jgi:hypothetical protein
VPGKRYVTYPELPDYGVPKYSRKHLLDLQRRGLFPKARQIGLNRIAWEEEEICAYVATRPIARSVLTVAPMPPDRRPEAPPSDDTGRGALEDEDMPGGTGVGSIARPAGRVHAVRAPSRRDSGARDAGRRGRR